MKRLFSTTDWFSRHEYVCLILIALAGLFIGGFK
ncbi:MAG: hypothetical protein JWQ10_295 [Herbaspirillum sp.]|nr:hypothetical protein [Herbaspirillum sp.]